ncbi:putative modified peptide [Paenibacillus sophorae]|uniref:NHLP-related RiPP peptide n=1 Tax=Paenibacillus sophorae TaxID=1333845 RepID=A0A1H8RZC8_9BACL|nr:NHLP-related RiPP peptide [Paenibacillus sophorae]QWU16910.1 NHLP-related RiPP peptide [Paenibacillus sophorae]SEO71647.1 putative modified peptide [Paenibacillus sophorae]
MNSHESEADNDKVPEFPAELPSEISLLLPNQQQRDEAALLYKLCSDDGFREKFWKDPAGAIVEAGFTADAETVDALHKADRVIFNQLVQDWKEALKRSGAFKWGKDPAVEPRSVVMLAAAVIAGAAVAGFVAGYLAGKSAIREGARKI